LRHGSAFEVRIGEREGARGWRHEPRFANLEVPITIDMQIPDD